MSDISDLKASVLEQAHEKGPIFSVRLCARSTFDFRGILREILRRRRQAFHSAQA